MEKFAVDMGHTLSGLGTGAVGLVKETDINRQVGKLVIKYLKEVGKQVVDCTVDYSSSDLSERTRLANQSGADFFISIHLNAGGGHGTETFTYLNASSSTKNVAKAVNDEVVNSCGFRNRGIKQGNFHVLRETKMSAILVELFFVDSAEDKAKFNVDKIARAIVKGLTGKTVGTSTPQPTPQPSQPSGDIKVGTKVQIVGNKYANVDKEVPDWAKKNTYEVVEVSEDKARLGDINSWLYHKDLKVVGTSTPQPSGTIGVGSKVKVIGSKYATGQSVADFVYNNTYEVIQMSGDKALLGSIMSWVYVKDLQLVSGGSTPAKTLQVGSKVKVKSSAKTYATGQGIASFVYSNTYKVIELKSDRALLDSIMSWVYNKDLEVL